MKNRYERSQPDKEIESPAGYYIPGQEKMLEYNGRTVIYVPGRVCLDSSCCGEGVWNYILMPGYLREGQSLLSASTSFEIETIEDEKERRDIQETLAILYPSVNIEMW
jgi:hypothetical protein